MGYFTFLKGVLWVNFTVLFILISWLFIRKYWIAIIELEDWKRVGGHFG